MINLIKNFVIVIFLSFYSLPLWAFTSSSFLVSQSAFKNYDYFVSINNLNESDLSLSYSSLLDKLIAATITEKINLAYKIADELLKYEKDNQEAYIVKLVFYHKNKKYNQINQLHNDFKNKNELIDFIFFNNNKIKNNQSISEALIDIVVSSFSNAEQRNLNYNFLLFYTSLGQIIDPKNDRAKIIKGELYQNIKKPLYARESFENINKGSPYYLEAQQSLAYNYSSYLSFEDAENKLFELLENTNNNYFIKKIFADFYRYEKKYDLAKNFYNEMIKENKSDLSNLYYMRGICYERLGDWKNAEKDFISSLNINPSSPNVLNYLAYGWVDRDMHLEKSLDMLKKAYNSNPESYYIIDSLAWAYFKKNNLDEAARLMEKVIDIAPGEAISLDHLGDIYYAMNRKREAIHFWQQALELAEPEDEIEESVQHKLNKFNAG